MLYTFTVPALYDDPRSVLNPICLIIAHTLIVPRPSPRARYRSRHPRDIDVMSLASPSDLVPNSLCERVTVTDPTELLGARTSTKQ